MAFWAVAAPLLSQLAQNVLQGINTRKARLYDSPAQQIKRYTEAGLPMAAASNINGGGGFTTQASIHDPSAEIQANLGASLKRQIDRKQIDLMSEQIKSAGADAAIAVGNAKNKLNPAGVFENTNQGITAQQEIQTQSNAIKTQQILNKYLPTEKEIGIQSSRLGMSKTAMDIAATAQNIRNAAVQEGILIHERDIKKVLAEYQPEMSRLERINLIRRNTGISRENELKRLEIAFQYQSFTDRLKLAEMNAKNAGQMNEAAILENIRRTAEQPGIANYYKIRANFDKAVLEKPNWMNTMIYLSLIQPQSSNFNFGNLQNFGAYHLGNLEK